METQLKTTKGRRDTGQWLAETMWRLGTMCSYTSQEPSEEGIADLETNPNTCRQDCHPAPHRGLHSSRQREQETWSNTCAQVWRLSSPGAMGPFLTRHVWCEICPLETNLPRAWQVLTLRGQSSGVSWCCGETEACRECLCRSGHHAYSVNVSGWELPSPRWTSEVFVITLVDRRSPTTLRLKDNDQGTTCVWRYLNQWPLYLLDFWTSVNVPSELKAPESFGGTLLFQAGALGFIHFQGSCAAAPTKLYPQNLMDAYAIK